MGFLIAASGWHVAAGFCLGGERPRLSALRARRIPREHGLAFRIREHGGEDSRPCRGAAWRTVALVSSATCLSSSPATNRCGAPLHPFFRRRVREVMDDTQRPPHVLARLPLESRLMRSFTSMLAGL